MSDETLRDLYNQTMKTYTIVTRSYDSDGNLTGESRSEHFEPYIKLTHDQCVEILRCLDSYGITREDAINFLRNDGWLKRHDKELTKNKEPVMVRSEFNNMCNMTFHYCGACGEGLPISAQRARFCPWCGRPVKWE